MHGQCGPGLLIALSSASFRLVCCDVQHRRCDFDYLASTQDVPVALIFVTVVTIISTNRKRRSKTMTHLPVSPKLQPMTKHRSLQSAETPWDRFIAAINNTELLVIIAICALGLLITLNFRLRFPDFGAVIEQYNRF
jgi:hypothetical protein